MSNKKTYVPILKWKPGERAALEYLDDDVKASVTPLVQMIMPKPKAPKKAKPGEPPVQDKTIAEKMEEVVESGRGQIMTFSKDVERIWGKGKLYFDLSLQDFTLRQEGYEYIIESGQKSDLNLVPVLSLSFDQSLQTAIIESAKKAGKGLCIRLYRSNLNDQKLKWSIDELLKTHDIRPEQIDILVDFQITDEKCKDITSVSKSVPHLEKWRTYTLASGSFPENLTKCELGENFIPRHEWKYWKANKTLQSGMRTPDFSDYTIQHPIHNEAVMRFTPSASIRYTVDDYWLIMRGQQGRYEQYPANAQLITKHKDYFGKEYSFGDNYISEKGSDLIGKPGNATNWLVVGVNHHLTCAVRQIVDFDEKK